MTLHIMHLKRTVMGIIFLIAALLYNSSVNKTSRNRREFGSAIKRRYFTIQLCSTILTKRILKRIWFPFQTS